MCSQHASSVDNINLSGKFGQIESFLYGSVTSSNHDYFFVFEERRITGSAVGDTPASKLSFSLHSQSFWHSSGSDNHSQTLVLLAGISGNDSFVPRQANFLCFLLFISHSQVLSLLLHQAGKLTPGDSFREARIVFYSFCNDGLATGG